MRKLVLILLIAHAATSLFLSATTSYISEGILVLSGGSGKALSHADIQFAKAQTEIMTSASVRNNGLERIKNEHPELLSKKISNFTAYLKDDWALFFLTVESDDPLYAQMYLKACIEEFLKLPSSSPPYPGIPQGLNWDHLDFSIMQQPPVGSKIDVAEQVGRDNGRKSQVIRRGSKTFRRHRPVSHL